MPRAFTDPERKVINARLLEQGYKLFAAFGLKKTNVEEIAVAAGISKGAFYLFYESKEALLMDLLEQAEAGYRKEVLAVIDLPGPSTRDRLLTILRTAFTLWKTFPILQLFAHGDYVLLPHRVPTEKMQEHLMSDQIFVQELITCCQGAGIPVVATAEQLSGLFYVIVFATLHENDFGQGSFPRTLDLLLELITAYCLGEMALPTQETPASFSSQLNEVNHDSRD